MPVILKKILYTLKKENYNTIIHLHIQCFD